MLFAVSTLDIHKPVSIRLRSFYRPTARLCIGASNFRHRRSEFSLNTAGADAMTMEPLGLWSFHSAAVEQGIITITHPPPPPPRRCKAVIYFTRGTRRICRRASFDAHRLRPSISTVNERIVTRISKAQLYTPQLRWCRKRIAA